MLIRIFTANNDRNKVKKQVWCSGIVARRLRIIVQEHLGKSCLRMKIHRVPLTRGYSHVTCYYGLSIASTKISLSSESENILRLSIVRAVKQRLDYKTLL